MPMLPSPSRSFFRKLQYRLIGFRDTNKWIALFRAIWLKAGNKKVVLYNKYHPIYYDYFLNERTGKLGWIYFSKEWKKGLPGKLLFRLADILHIDAASFDKFYCGLGKRLVVECEARAKPELMDSNEVQAVFFQSQFAGRMQLNHPKASLLYPAIGRYTEKHRSAPDEFTLLSVGFGSFVKGFDVSYAVYRQLKQKGYKVKLLLAGVPGHDFDLYPEVTREAHDAAGFDQMMKEIMTDPDVKMAAFNRLEMLKYVYPQADILLHFSRMETFGFTLLEAMAFAMPAVSVRFKAIPEMVQHEKTGFLCNPFHWDGVSEIDELSMNTPAWRDACIAEGVKYTEQLITNRALYESASACAMKGAERFSYEMRTRALFPAYGITGA